MPKEITHWILADRVARSLDEGYARRAVTAHPNLYSIGAVLPYTPFYTLVGRYTETFTTLAERLHSRWGEDSFDPVRNMLVHYGKRMNEARWAAVFGVLTHIVADAVHHPMVMYYSGCPHDMPPALKTTSLCRHRVFEAYLDLRRLADRPGADRWSLYSMLRQKEMNSVQFYRMLSVLYFGRPGVYFPHLRTAMASHVLFHRVFHRRYGLPLVRHGNRATGGKWWHVEALYNPPGPNGTALDPALFAAAVPYRHPVTGRASLRTVDQLAARTVSVARELFRQVERHIADGTVREYFDHVRGPSLENGLVGVPTREMVYYDLDTDLRNVIGVEPELCPD